MQEKNKLDETPKDKKENLLDKVPDIPKSHKLMSRQDDPDALFVENEFEVKTELDKNNTGKDSVRLPDFVNDPNVEPLELKLTEDDKLNVMGTWNTLKENYGIKAIGKIFLKQFFKNSVDSFQAFLQQEQIAESKTIEQIQTSKAFCLIAMKCSKTICKIVELICKDEGDNIIDELKKMGHIYMQWYKVLPDHYHTAQLSILAVMKMGLQENFTQEVRDSWNSFLKFSKQALISNNYTKEEGTNDDLHPEDEAAITIQQVNHVQETWAECEKLDLQNVGLIVFKQFLSISPESKQLFPFDDYASQDSITDEFYQSPKVQKHCLKVAQTVGWAVQNLENEALFCQTVQDLGKRHVKYGMKAEHIPAIGQALLNTVSMALKEKFTEEVSLAWEKFIQLVADNMISDNFSEAGKVVRKQTTLFLDKGISQNIMQGNSQSNQKFMRNKTMMLKESAEEQIQPIKEDQNKNNQIITSQTMKIDGPNGLNQQDQKKVPELSRTHKQTMIERKVIKVDTKIDNQLQSVQKQKYVKYFQKEVDFHHNIAFKFERAYRLSKKLKSQANQSDLNSSQDSEQIAEQVALQKNIKMINTEIIDCLSDHSGYIEHDPMTLFYCLFFCIFYRNSELIEYFRMMIKYIQPESLARKKLEKTIEYIDINGIDCLRDTSEKMNSIVYHMVFYQAIDDDLRIVYQMIMRQVKFLQMRDKDALHLLRQRDYELIKHTFKLSTTKLKQDLFMQEKQRFRCNSYRKYNQAYYEEIIITNQGSIEERIFENYRERFLVSHEDIYVVFQMYCKEDYEKEFLQTKKDDITHKEFVELFKICLRNDSHRIGILIYTLYLDRSVDIDANMMNIVIQSCRSSTLLHEIKLFYIHSNFDVLSILQMDSLIDVYTEICSTKTLKLNPMISQYNVIKIALLIYRICWRIEQKQIYSLITKCYDLQRYILNSLKAFIEKQNNILMVLKFLSEPILDLSKKYDSFDIMVEMNMQELLTHPVIVEVLNLVYEGKYSASQNALSLSSTYQFGSEVDAMSNKSIMDRIVGNIKSFGELTTPKQTSLQFAIWKQSIQQREQDEIVFTVLINLAIILLSIALNFNLNTNYHEFRQNFGGYIPIDPKLWDLVDQEKIKNICGYLQETENFRNIYYLAQALNYAILFNMIGTIANIIQKTTLARLKDNVVMSKTLIIGEIFSIIVSMLILRMFYAEVSPSIYYEKCLQNGFEILPYEQLYLDKVLDLEKSSDNSLNFRFLISISTIQAILTIITFLQKTALLGLLLTTLDFMNTEFMRFCVAFSYIFLGFLIASRFLEKQISLSIEVETVWIQLRNLIETFVGMPHFNEYSSVGRAFMACFMLIFKVLLICILGSIFINRYNTLFRNFENLRLNKIITLKNQLAYDKYIGGVTISFFPINIIMIPFLPVVASLRNPRVSEFVLKIQYMFLMILYLVLAMIQLIPMLPYFYFKIILNSLYMATSNAKKENGVQKVSAIVFATTCGPIALLLSVIVDLATLPDTLLKDQKIFERKYGSTEASINEEQVPKVMKVFDSLLGEQYELRFKNRAISLIELMTMHRRIFNITANMHELLCRGTKDYRQSLSTVHDFNMSKLLSLKCSIPSPDGDMKNSKVEFDVLSAVYRDIKLYNFVDVTIRKLNMGKLRESVALAEEGKQLEDTKVNDNFDENEEDDELRKVEGILPIEIGPDNVPLKRNTSDVMGNFFINNVTRAFTNIENILSKVTSVDEIRRQNRITKEIEDRKFMWMKNITGNFEQQRLKYNQIINSDLMKGNSQNKNKFRTQNSRFMDNDQSKQETTYSAN